MNDRWLMMIDRVWYCFFNGFENVLYTLYNLFIKRSNRIYLRINSKYSPRHRLVIQLTSISNNYYKSSWYDSHVFLRSTHHTSFAKLFTHTLVTIIGESYNSRKQTEYAVRFVRLAKVCEACKVKFTRAPCPPSDCIWCFHMEYGLVESWLMSRTNAHGALEMRSNEWMRANVLTAL